MRQLVYILFLGLAVYHSLGLLPGMDEGSQLSQSTVKQSLNAGDQSSPFIHLRIPNTADLVGKFNFVLVSEDQVRINGHLYDLVGLSIFEGFVDLRIVLNDVSEADDLMQVAKDFQTDKGGLNLKSGPVFILFTPPVAFRITELKQGDGRHVPCPFLAENPLSGFEKISGQPPRI
mgnify:CR=1 FL=1